MANDNEESRPGQDLAGFRQTLKERQRDGAKRKNSDHVMGSVRSTAGVDDREGDGNANEIDYFA